MIAPSEPAVRAAFAAVFERLAAELGAGATRIVITPLRYAARPYSHIVLAEATGGDRPLRFYAKIGKASPTLESDSPDTATRYRTEFELLSRLSAELRDDAALGVVQPMALFEEFPAIVTLEAPGRDFLAEIKATASFGASAAAEAALATYARLCGAFLKRFHGALPVAGAWTLEDMRDYIDRRLRHLVETGWGGIDLRWRDRTLRWFDDLAADVSPADLALVAVHGDFGLSNVVVHGGRVAVLDVSMFQQGSALLDLTHIHHQLVQLGAHPRFTRAFAARLARALIEGFDAVLDPGAPLFQLFRLQHMACQMARLADARDQPWLSRLYDRYVTRRNLAWLADAAGARRPS